MRGGLVVLLALFFTQGCSSSYEPARSPRIATVVDGGQPTFVKNGERLGNISFGSGLIDAVQGNPRAEHHARVGRNLEIGGFVVSMVGLGTEIGGLVALAQDNTQHPNLGSALVITGVVTVIAGTVMILAGQPHIYDAVNIYNDGLDARPTTLPTAAHLGPRAN